MTAPSDPKGDKPIEWTVLCADGTPHFTPRSSDTQEQVLGDLEWLTHILAPKSCRPHTLASRFAGGPWLPVAPESDLS